VATGNDFVENGWQLEIILWLTLGPVW